MLPPNDVSDAQNLEDVRLWRVLYDCPDKFFVDVGASHPTKLSITKWFSERDWQGINIEPSPDTVTDRATVNLENATDPELKQISPAVSTVRVKQRPLVDVLSEHAAKTPIGFLSVNVEGAEADVLTSNDWERYRPRVVVVEAIDPITLFPNHQNWESILLAAGYLYAVSDGMNRFYVAQEYPELLERFGFDFTGRLSNSRPDDYELLNQNNLALIDQLQAAKNSWSFRLGHAALRPLRSLRPLRPLRNKIITAHWKSRSKNIQKTYRRYTAKDQPLRSVKTRGPIWADCPPQTLGLNELRPYLNSRHDQPARPTTPAEADLIRNLAKDDSMPNSIGYFARQFINLRELPDPVSTDKISKTGCVLLDLRVLQIMARENIKNGLLNYSGNLVGKVVETIKRIRGTPFRVIGLVDPSPTPISSYLVENLDRAVYPSELGSIGEIALAIDPVIMTVGKWTPTSGDFLTIIPKGTPSAGIWWDNTLIRFGDYFADSPLVAIELIRGYENYSKYNYVLTLTKSAQFDGQRLFSQSAQVFNIGASSLILDRVVLTDSTKPHNNQVILMGNGLPHKNLAAGVCAFARLRQESFSLTILALIHPDQKDALLNLATDLGLAENQIKFESQVDAEKHFALLSQSSVLIAPSLAEGLDLPVIESIHCGTPVVGSSIPVHEELIGPGWWLTDGEDPIALGKALCLALQDPAGLIVTQRELLKKRWWPTRLEEEVREFINCALGVQDN